MFTPEYRMRVMKIIAKLTYIICVLAGIVRGVCFGFAFENGGIRLIVAIIGGIIGGLLGYLLAWLIDLITYTTIVRFDQILLELCGGMEIYTDGKPSGNLASREQIRSLRDIKETLENNTAVIRSQTAALTKLIELLTADKATNAQSIDSRVQARSDVKPKESMSALMTAASGSTSTEELKSLIEAASATNVKKETEIVDPVKVAWKNANENTVKTLLDAGFNVNMHDVGGISVLMQAAKYSANPSALKALVAAGADLNARDNDGKTALMFAAEHNSNPDVINALIAAGSDVNTRDNQGNTALIHAVLVSGAPDVVKALVDAGSDVNTRGNSGKRPIDILDERSDKDTFAGSAAYWAMRKLLY